MYSKKGMKFFTYSVIIIDNDNERGVRNEITLWF